MIGYDEGSARSYEDARERLDAATTTDELAEAYVALRGGAVDDDTLWAMGSQRFDQLDAASKATKARRPTFRTSHHTRYRAPKRPGGTTS